MSLTKAMSFEDIKPKSKPSKDSIRAQALRELDRYNSSTILWHLAKRHKFSIVVTILITYIAFNSFGTLIVGLAESIK